MNFRTSKIFSITSSFSQYQWKGLILYLKSPFHNQRKDILQLAISIKEITYLDSPQMEINEEELFARVFPGRAFDHAKWQHTKSFLHIHVKKYLALARYQKDETLQATYALQDMRKLKKEDFIGKEIRQIEKKHFSKELASPGQLYNAFRFQYEKYEWQQTRDRNATSSMVVANQCLDQFYLAEKLRIHANALIHQFMTDFNMPDPFIDTIISHARSQQDDLPVLIQLYLHAVLALRNPSDEDHFQKFKSLLKETEAKMEPSVIKDCITMGINFCIKKLNDGNRAYVEEVFDLYRFGLDNESFLENGYLSRFTYKNIVTAAVGQGDFEWAEEFIEKYRDKLDPQYRENTYRYNLAILKYKSQMFEETKELLRDVDFEDLFFNLNARLMLLKIYYEGDNWSTLLSHLDSFKAFLYRHTELGYQKKAYLNLVKYSKKILSIAPFDKKRRQALEEKLIAEKIVAEKSWLLEKLQAS